MDRRKSGSFDLFRIPPKELVLRESVLTIKDETKYLDFDMDVYADYFYSLF